MKTPKGMCTHVFYKKGASENEKEEVMAMARDINNSKGCVVKMYGNNVEFSPFMYNSPSSIPMTAEAHTKAFTIFTKENHQRYCKG